MFNDDASGAVLVEHILRALDLLDYTMIANLIWFISAGSYYVFLHPYPSPTDTLKPRSLAHISTGVLKEKMAGSVVGISSIGLLDVFMHIVATHGAVDMQKVIAMLAIHVAIIAGFLAFNYANQADHHKHPEEKETSNAPHT
jgi:uncharacterized protein (TIGR00645 family)